MTSQRMNWEKQLPVRRNLNWAQQLELAGK
jgi:hypothetical protein